jgi:hypothetical protein
VQGRKRKTARNSPGGCGLYRLTPTRHRPGNFVLVVVVALVVMLIAEIIGKII